MKKALGIIVRWLVAAGILFYLFHYKIDLGKLFTTVSQAWWGWIAAAVMLYGVTFGSGVMRWHALLRSQQIQIDLRHVLLICFVGQLFNAFMLGGTGGDVVKAYYATHQTKTNKPEAVMSVLVDRLIGLSGLFTIVLVMLALNIETLREHRGLQWPVTIVVGFIGVVLIIIPLSLWPGRFPWLQRLAARLPAYEHLHRAVSSYRRYVKHPQVLVQAWGWSLLVHVSNFVGAGLLGKGLGITGAGWNEYFLLVPLINTIASLPITVAGFGVREEMYRRTFGIFGVPAESAVALGLLNYTVQLLWSLVGGLVYVLWKHEPALLRHAREELANQPGVSQ